DRVSERLGLDDLPSEDRPRQEENPARKSPEEWLRRHSDVSFPARVPAGKPCNLRVQVVPAEVTLPTGEVRPVPKPRARDAPLGLPAPPVPPGEPPPPVRLTVSVAAENFDVEDDPRADLLVPYAGKSAALAFRLRGQAVGPGRVMVD